MSMSSAGVHFQKPPLKLGKRWKSERNELGEDAPSSVKALCIGVFKKKTHTHFFRKFTSINILFSTDIWKLEKLSRDTTRQVHTGQANTIVLKTNEKC